MRVIRNKHIAYEGMFQIPKLECFCTSGGYLPYSYCCTQINMSTTVNFFMLSRVVLVNSFSRKNDFKMHDSEFPASYTVHSGCGDFYTYQRTDVEPGEKLYHKILLPPAKPRLQEVVPALQLPGVRPKTYLEHQRVPWVLSRSSADIRGGYEYQVTTNKRHCKSSIKMGDL